MEPQIGDGNPTSVVFLLPAGRRKCQKEGLGSYKYCSAVTCANDGWLFLCLYFIALRSCVALGHFLKSVASSGLATCGLCVLCDFTSTGAGGYGIYGPTTSPRPEGAGRDAFDDWSMQLTVARTMAKIASRIKRLGAASGSEGAANQVGTGNSLTT